MAFSHGKDAAIYVGGYKFTCYARSVSRSGRKQLADVTTLCDDAERFLPGQQGGSLSIEGLFDPTFAAVLDSEFGAGSALPVTYVVSSESGGGDAYVLQARSMSFDVQSQVGDAVAAVVEFQADGVVARGKHFGEADITGTGSAAFLTTAVQVGVAASHVYANAHVMAITSGTISSFEVYRNGTDTWSGSEIATVAFSNATAIGAEYYSSTLISSSQFYRPKASFTPSATATVLVAVATI